MSKNTWKDKLQLAGVGLLAVVCAAAAIVFKLSGRNILTLNPGETVGWVRHFSADGVLLHKVYLPQYPEPFDPAHTEKLFSDVRTGDFLEFEIVRHRFLDRMISVEIS